MAWARIHDGAMSHPKIMALSDSAFRVWVKGLAYCQLNLTDGLIPMQAAKELGASKRLISELISPLSGYEFALWEVHPIGFCVRDYLFWNDSRERIQTKQLEAKERRRRWEEKQQSERVQEQRQERVPNSVPNVRHTIPLHTTPVLIRESPSDSPAFDEFWAAYPKKVGKDAARKAFAKRRPDADLLDAMLSALSAQSRSEQWRRDGGRFVPHPSTWLNEGRWQDEPERTGPVAVGSRRRWTPDDCPHGHECGSATICDNRSAIESARASRAAS